MLLYIDLQHNNLAVEKSNKALEKYPSQPLFYLINGVALNKLNQPKKAIEILESGLDYIIDDAKMEADFYNQISIAYTLLNDPIKAKSYLDKGKTIRPKN